MSATNAMKLTEKQTKKKRQYKKSEAQKRYHRTRSSGERVRWKDRLFAEERLILYSTIESLFN